MPQTKKSKEMENLRNIDSKAKAPILTDAQYRLITQLLSLIKQNLSIDDVLMELGWRVGSNPEWTTADELWQFENVYLPPYSRCLTNGEYCGVFGVDFIFRMEDVKALADFNHQYLLVRPNAKGVAKKAPWNTFVDFRSEDGQKLFLPRRIEYMLHNDDCADLCRQSLLPKMLDALRFQVLQSASKFYFVPPGSKAYKLSANKLLNTSAYRCGVDYFEPGNLLNYFATSPEKERGGSDSDSDLSTSPASSQASTPERQTHSSAEMTDSPARKFSDQQEFQMYLMEEDRPTYGPISGFLKNLGWKSLYIPPQVKGTVSTALCSARILAKNTVENNTLKSLKGFKRHLDYYEEADDKQKLIEDLKSNGVEKFLRDRKCYTSPSPFTVEKFKSPLKDKSTGKTDSSAFTNATSMMSTPQNNNNQVPTSSEEDEIERRLFQLKPFMDYEEARIALITYLQETNKPLHGTVAQLMNFLDWKMRLYENKPYFCPPRFVQKAKEQRMFDSLGFYFIQDPREKFRLNVDFYDFETLKKKLKADADDLIDQHFIPKKFEVFSVEINGAIEAIYRYAEPKINDVNPLLKEFGWDIYWQRDHRATKYLSPYMISKAKDKGYLTSNRYIKNMDMYTDKLFITNKHYFDCPNDMLEMFRQMREDLIGFLRAGFTSGKEEDVLSPQPSQMLTGSPEYFKLSSPKLQTESSPLSRNASGLSDEMDISPLSEAAGDDEGSHQGLQKMSQEEEQEEGVECEEDEGTVATANTASTMSSFKRELQSGNTPYRVLRSFLKDLGWTAVYPKCDISFLVSPVGLQKEGQNGFIIKDRGSYLSVQDYSSLTLISDYFDESNNDQKEVILQLMRASEGRYGQVNFPGFNETGKLQVYLALQSYCEHGSHRLEIAVVHYYRTALGWQKGEQRSDGGKIIVHPDEKKTVFHDPSTNAFIDEVKEFVRKEIVKLQKKLLPPPPPALQPQKRQQQQKQQQQHVLPAVTTTAPPVQAPFQELVTELHNNSPFQLIRTLLLESHGWGVFYLERENPRLLTPFGQRTNGPFVISGVYISRRSEQGGSVKPQATIDYFDEKELGHRELLLALLLASQGQYGQLDFNCFDEYGCNIMYIKLQEYLETTLRPSSYDTVWLYLKAVGWQERFSKEGKLQLRHENHPDIVLTPEDETGSNKKFLRDELPSFLQTMIKHDSSPQTSRYSSNKKKASVSTVKKSSTPQSMSSSVVSDPPIADGVLGDLQIELRNAQPYYSTIFECLKHFTWSIRYATKKTGGGYDTLLCTPRGLQTIARLQPSANKTLTFKEKESLAVGIDYFDSTEHQPVLIEVLRATNGHFAEPSFEGLQPHERDAIFRAAYNYSQTRRMLPELIPVFMKVLGWVQEDDYLYSPHFLSKVNPTLTKARQHMNFTENYHFFAIKYGDMTSLIAYIADRIATNIGRDDTSGLVISPDVAGRAMIQPSSDISTHPQRMDEIIDLTGGNDDENDVTRDEIMAVDNDNNNNEEADERSRDAEEQEQEEQESDHDVGAMEEGEADSRKDGSNEDVHQNTVINTRTRRAALSKPSASIAHETTTAATTARSTSTRASTRGSTRGNVATESFTATTAVVQTRPVKDAYSKRLRPELARQHISFLAVVKILLDAKWKKVYLKGQCNLCTPTLYEHLEEEGYILPRKDNYLYVDSMVGERDIDYFSELDGKNQLYAILKAQGAFPIPSQALQREINRAKQDYAENNCFYMTTRSPRRSVKTIQDGQDDYDRMTYDNHLGSPADYHCYEGQQDEEYFMHNTTKMDVEAVSNDFYDMKIGHEQNIEDRLQIHQLAGLHDTNFNTEMNDAELKEMVSENIKFEAIYNHLRLHHGWKRDLNIKAPLNQGKFKVHQYVYFCDYKVTAEKPGLEHGEDYFYTEDEVLEFLRELLEINTVPTAAAAAAAAAVEAEVVAVKKGKEGSKKRRASNAVNDENNMNSSNKRTRRSSASSAQAAAYADDDDAMDVDDSSNEELQSSQESSSSALSSEAATVIQAQPQRQPVQAAVRPPPRRIATLAHAQSSHEVNINHMTVEEYLKHAHHQLQAESGGDESSYPIPFREQECMIIKDKIINHLERGQGGLIYVCGSAGGGKTLSTLATLRNIIEMIRQSGDCSHDINVVNTKGGMDKLPDVMSSLATDIESSRYSMFYAIHHRTPEAHELNKKDYKNKSKNEIMELINAEFNRPAVSLYAQQSELDGLEYFTKADKHHSGSNSSEKKQKKKAVPMTILLVDEFQDYDGPVKYHLLKLACSTPSSLLIIGTGNSVTLPPIAEKSSLMTRLIFETYSMDALSKLLHNRVQGLFDVSAEKYFIGKIARVHHSDPRKLLEFADAALSCALESRKFTAEQLAATMSAELLPLVTLKDVRNVIEGPSLAQKFARFAGKFHMQMIVALVTLGQGFGADEQRRPFFVDDVLDAMANLFRDVPGYNQPSPDMVDDGLKQLAANDLMMIVSAGRQRKDGVHELPVYAIVPGLTCSEILKGLPEDEPFIRRRLQDYMQFR